jgi:hypothetical protein
MLPQRMIHSVNAIPLMAIPLFMVAGELMVGLLFTAARDGAPTRTGVLIRRNGHLDMGSACIGGVMQICGGDNVR